MQRRAAWTFIAIGLAATGALVAWLGAGIFDAAAPDERAAVPSSDAPPPAIAESGQRPTTRPTLRPGGGRRPAPPAASDRVRRDGSTEDAPEGNFDGIVVDENGRTVGGATVTVLSQPAVTFSSRLPLPSTLTTNEDGSFKIHDDLFGREIRVRATATGRSPVHGDEAMRRGAVTRITLVSACPIRVRVVEKGSGKAVAGAQVRSICGAAANIPGDDVRSLPYTDIAATDWNGAATLRTPGGPAAVWVKSPVCAPAVHRGLNVPAHGIDVTIALDAGGVVEGRVVDPKGAPASAMVLARGPLGYEGESGTKADGTFMLDHVPFGADAELTLVVNANEFPLSVTKVRIAASGQRANVLITLKPYQRMPGKVTRANGAPVFGAEVTAWDSEPASLPWGDDFDPDPDFLPVVTDRAGEFVLDRFPAGPGTVRVEERIGDAVRSAERTVRAPDDAPLTLVLDDAVEGDKPGGLSVRVRVVDAGGAPVKDVLVEDVVVRDGVGLVGSETTGADGRATLTGLPAGRSVLVVHPQTSATLDVPIELSAATKDEVVVKIPSGAVEGRVIRPDGSPAQITLRLEHLIRAPSGQETVFWGWNPSTTDTKGRFRFTGVGEGEYRVVPEDPSLTTVPSPVVAHAGDTNLEILVASLAEEASLHVEAELTDDSTGSALTIESIPVSVVGRGGAARADSLLRIPDEPNLYRVARALAPDIYDVHLAAPGYEVQVVRGVRVPNGDAPPRIRARLHPSSSPPDATKDTSGSLRVRLADGRRPAGAVVVTLDPIDPRGGASPDPSALRIAIDVEWMRANPPARILPSLSPGRYRVTIAWDGLLQPPREVEIRERETATIDVSAP